MGHIPEHMLAGAMGHFIVVGEFELGQFLLIICQFSMPKVTKLKQGVKHYVIGGGFGGLVPL